MQNEAESRTAKRKHTNKPRRRAMGQWARTLLVFAAATVLLAFTVTVFLKVIKPFRELSTEHAQLAQNLRDIQQLQQENMELERHIAIVKTPDGLTSEARKLGFVKPNEIPIVVQNLDDQWKEPQDASGTKGGEQPKSSTGISDWLRALHRR